MNDYTTAPATKLLATHCVVCGRALVDATSVELGIGPECRNGNDGGIGDDVRQEANKYVHTAAIAAQQGHVEKVIECATAIKEMGLTELATKVGRRFKNAAKRTVIAITVDGDMMRVETPFRRGDKEAFINAWRNIPGRRYRNGANYVPVAQKQALWKLLQQFFGGKYGTGPKGIFRIPLPEPKPEQQDLALS